MLNFNYRFFLATVGLLSALTTQASTQLRSISFENLPGWNQAANLSISFAAFKQSCPALLSNDPTQNAGTPLIALRKNNWLPICRAADKITNPNQQNTQAFFQRWFTPIAVSSDNQSTGLFTGYYLPTIPASEHYSAAYSVPIYGRPNDLITAKLGLFDSTLQGKRIAGHVIDGRLYPYGVSRIQIDAGALKNKASILLWTRTRADRFFLQIQGSGIAELTNGSRVLLGYDGDNGEPYYPIGRWLIAKKILSKNTISMQSIYQWLLNHPQQADEVMNQDASFVFFKRLNGDAAIGSEKVALTPGYSLAVDNTLIPLGLPIWLNTTLPNQQLFNRLMVAQDTGGAIRGAIRGDIYFGAGEKAAALAGPMKNPGKYWLLLPR